MSLFTYSAQQPTTTMKQFEASFCMNYKTDPYLCIGCDHECANGKAAVAQLEKETKRKNKNIGPIACKIRAMSDYYEAMIQDDPTKHLMEKFGILEHQAKHKFYTWQKTYGKNSKMIAEKIKELKEEIGDKEEETEKELPVVRKAVIETKTQEIPQEEKKMTKRQEEKISQARLEQMRLDLEAEYLKAEAEIETHKKEITECEKRMEEITDEINSIRRVLDIFKKKDALYV